jgi:uncharacterized protein YqhQ
MSELAVGGQAVIEGVMMRSPRALAVAVRKKTGEIAVQEMAWRKVLPDWRVFKWPLIRGAVVLIESMANGMRALSFANAQVLGEDEEGAAPKGAAAGAIGFAALIGVLLFVAAPHFASSGLGRLLGFDDVNDPSFHLVAGLVKLGIFFGYVAILGRLPDMQRVFQYHGAEHKSIYAFEAGAPLTVENARAQSRFHPRCGTAFIFAVAGIAILFWTLAFPLISPYLVVTEIGWLQNVVYVLVKLPMMLPIAGLAYELTRFSSKKQCGPILRVLTAPGLWLQRLTTREPDDSQLEVALAALRLTLAREREAGATSREELHVFPSYQAIDLPVL